MNGLPVAERGKSWLFVKNARRLHVKHEAERHVRAAEAHAICSNWTDAADCYKRAAYIWGRQLKCPYEAASLYQEAATALKRFHLATRTVSMIKHKQCIVIVRMHGMTSPAVLKKKGQ